MKTIIDSEGKVLFFNYEDFIQKIVIENNCFICGTNPNDKEFNDEHIIPNWILAKYNLYDKQITLTNATKFKYGQYTIPCCKECNSELGEKIELPISNLLKKIYEEILCEISLNPKLIQELFKWLNLMFLKTHLKDKTLLMNRDFRFDEGKIGDYHNWNDLHHIHCIARSYYTNAKIESKVFGTTLIFPTVGINKKDQFDYIDSVLGKVVMIQLDTFCMIAVLDDAGATGSIYREEIKKLNGSLNEYQVRELISHFSFINLNLKDRPIFKSLIENTGNRNYLMLAEIPEFCRLKDKKNQLNSVKEFLYYFIKLLVKDSKENAKMLEFIKQGIYSYLFNAMLRKKLI